MEARSVVITGASSGIGAALSIALAAPGRRILLIGRDTGRLAAVSAAAEARGATAETAALDVTDAEALAARLLAHDAAAPVDLLIANAGVSAGRRPGGALEGHAEAVRVVATNLLGAINTVEPLLPAMRRRGGGRIALVSSLAALRPLPAMPAYGASKAGIRAYGTALRGALAADGISVTVICPGFVRSPMSERHRGAQPFRCSSERAAAIMLRGIERRRALVSFPWPMVLLAWLGARLPPSLSDRAIRPFAAEILAERQPACPPAPAPRTGSRPGG